MQRLLSVILKINEENIKDADLKNNELEGTYYGDKKSVLDIRLTYNDNTKVNIEMQNIWGDDYIKRVLFYWSKRCTDNFQKGQAYDELQKTIVISILGEKFPYQDELYSIARLYFEKDKKIASDSMELHFLDLTKVDDKNIDDLNKWMLFLKTEDMEVRSMLSMQDYIMKQANDFLKVL